MANGTEIRLQPMVLNIATAVVDNLSKESRAIGKQIEQMSAMLFGGDRQMDKGMANNPVVPGKFQNESMFMADSPLPSPKKKSVIRDRQPVYE